MKSEDNNICDNSNQDIEIIPLLTFLIGSNVVHDGQWVTSKPGPLIAFNHSRLPQSVNLT